MGNTSNIHTHNNKKTILIYNLLTYITSLVTGKMYRTEVHEVDNNLEDI